MSEDHVALPDESTISGDPSTGVEVSHLPPSEGVSMLPATATISEERITYLFKINLGHTGFASLTPLTHTTQFTQEQLDTMIAEAVKIVMDLRVIRRRKAIAEGDFQITTERDPIKARAEIAKKNEEWFSSDADLLEAVMCDKYGFLILKVNNISATLEPTARL